MIPKLVVNWAVAMPSCSHLQIKESLGFFEILAKSPASDPAKVSPQRDRGEFCQDRTGPVVQRHLLQLLRKDDLDPKEDGEVEHGVDDGAGPDGEEEEESGVRLSYPGVGARVLDHSASKTKEGGRNKEWEKLADQRKLLIEGSPIEKVLWFGSQVDLCIDLANGEKWAGNGSKEERSPTHPDVEQ